MLRDENDRQDHVDSLCPVTTEKAYGETFRAL